MDGAAPPAALPIRAPFFFETEVGIGHAARSALVRSNSGSSHRPCGPGLRWGWGSRAVQGHWRGQLGKQVRLAEPLGLQSRVAAGLSRGAGHSAWPNTRYVNNALANSMRSGVAGSTPD